MASDTDEENVAVVLDVGSYHLSYGMSGDDIPKFSKLATATKDDTNNGQAPVYKAKLVDKERIDEIIKMAVEDLGVQPEDKFLLMSNPASMSMEDKMSLCEIVFESSTFPGFLTLSETTLGLYSTGRTSGLCLDVGHTMTTAAPVFEGYPLTGCPSTITSPISGLQLDELLKKLNPKLAVLDSVAMTAVKKQLCQVAENEPTMIPEYEMTDFVLPDESKVSVGNETKRAPEFLFSPHYFGVKSPGCHEMIYNSLHKVDPDGHKEIIENVLPMGGTTRMQGFAKRLQLELLGVLDYEFNVIDQSPAEKEHMSWIGGSVCGELTTFAQMWVFRSEFEEEGVERICKKKFMF